MSATGAGPTTDLLPEGHRHRIHEMGPANLTVSSMLCCEGEEASAELVERREQRTMDALRHRDPDRRGNHVVRRSARALTWSLGWMASRGRRRG